ncbi:hypothetical protein [Rhizobium mesosinicum]|uniref:Uncharacterized protein n=1 Tax=Rhizobium mesosinicum TaxID=335017 RepID=A0ABS7GSY3_9HYPH|nr:hypothetical protein [Rhizobium mesosinicum]MBW9052329.1 hypothetical protein [Rhizobium mesosinicum]
MLRVFAAGVMIAAAVLIGYAGATKTVGQKQANADSQTEKKPPKAGYPDLFIPPTKGNGF